LALIFAIAFAALETAGFLAAMAGLAAAFFATGFAAALIAFAGAALAVVVVALGAGFFAVAMIEFPFDLFGESEMKKSSTEPLYTSIAANYQRCEVVMMNISK
jgi:fatty acid desaturase